MEYLPAELVVEIIARVSSLPDFLALALVNRLFYECSQQAKDRVCVRFTKIVERESGLMVKRSWMRPDGRKQKVTYFDLGEDSEVQVKLYRNGLRVYDVKEMLESESEAMEEFGRTTVTFARAVMEYVFGNDDARKQLQGVVCCYTQLCCAQKAVNILAHCYSHAVEYQMSERREFLISMAEAVKMWTADDFQQLLPFENTLHEVVPVYMMADRAQWDKLITRIFDEARAYFVSIDGLSTECILSKMRSLLLNAEDQFLSKVMNFKLTDPRFLEPVLHEDGINFMASPVLLVSGIISKQLWHLSRYSARDYFSTSIASKRTHRSYQSNYYSELRVKASPRHARFKEASSLSITLEVHRRDETTKLYLHTYEVLMTLLCLQLKNFAVVMNPKASNRILGTLCPSIAAADRLHSLTPYQTKIFSVFSINTRIPSWTTPNIMLSKQHNFHDGRSRFGINDAMNFASKIQKEREYVKSYAASLSSAPEFSHEECGLSSSIVSSDGANQLNGIHARSRDSLFLPILKRTQDAHRSFMNEKTEFVYRRRWNHSQQYSQPCVFKSADEAIFKDLFDNSASVEERHNDGIGILINSAVRAVLAPIMLGISDMTVWQKFTDATSSLQIASSHITLLRRILQLAVWIKVCPEDMNIEDLRSHFVRQLEEVVKYGDIVNTYIASSVLDLLHTTSEPLHKSRDSKEIFENSILRDPCYLSNTHPEKMPEDIHQFLQDLRSHCAFAIEDITPRKLALYAQDTYHNTTAHTFSISWLLLYMTDITNWASSSRCPDSMRLFLKEMKQVDHVFGTALGNDKSFIVDPVSCALLAALNGRQSKYSLLRIVKRLQAAARREEKTVTIYKDEDGFHVDSAFAEEIYIFTCLWQNLRESLHTSEV